MNADQTTLSANAEEAAIDPVAAAPQPSKKETSLREFMSKMDDYAPIVCSFTLFPFSLSVSQFRVVYHLVLELPSKLM